MNIVRTITGAYPISLADAKMYLKANDYTTDDLLITQLIASATVQAEKFCNRSFVPQTIQYHEAFKADELDAVTELRLPYPNHVAVTEVKINGVVTTGYTVVGLNKLIVNVTGVSIGDAGIYAQVIVKYTAGDCSEAEKLAIKNIVRDMYFNRADGPLNENAYVYLMPHIYYS